MRGRRSPAETVGLWSEDDRPGLPGERELQPVHFQMIFDLVDSLQPAYRLLRHLLLVVRIHNSPQHHATLLGLEAELPLPEVWIFFDGRGNE
jgi:hypothetical protein